MHVGVTSYLQKIFFFACSDDVVLHTSCLQLSSCVVVCFTFMDAILFLQLHNKTIIGFGFRMIALIILVTVEPRSAIGSFYEGSLYRKPRYNEFVRRLTPVSVA